MPRRNRTAVMALIAAAMLMTVEAEPVYAEIYKSIDKDGRITYSNTPMPGAVTTAVLDNPPAPSEEDVRAAQEAYKQIKMLGTEMEKRRWQLEEQRARLNMEERMYEAYLRQSRAPVLGYDVPWVFAIESGTHRKLFNKSPRTRDGKIHRPLVDMRVGMGQRPP